MVAKIIKTLAIVVGCVIIAVFALKVLLPNTVNAACNVVEKAINSATGISLDLNGDGNTGTGAETISSGDVEGISTSIDIEGFQGLRE